MTEEYEIVSKPYLNTNRWPLRARWEWEAEAITGRPGHAIRYTTARARHRDQAKAVAATKAKLCAVRSRKEFIESNTLTESFKVCDCP